MRPHIIEVGDASLIVNLLSTGQVSVQIICRGGGHTILLSPLEASEASVALISCVKGAGR